MSLLSNLFGNLLGKNNTLAASLTRAAVRTIVDQEVDSLFDHNPPAVISMKIVDWARTSQFRNEFAAFGLNEVDALLASVPTDRWRGAVKTFLHSKLNL